MIKDSIFKALCIPLLGLFIPILSHLIHYQELSVAEVLLSNLFFMATSFIIWQGSVAIVANVRNNKVFRQKVFLKIFFLCLLTALYSFMVAGCAAYLWQKMVLKQGYVSSVVNCGLISSGCTVFLALVYEALFLSKERELDIKIVDQLDKERIDAEISALKGELDPHFIFNALTSLSHLISAEPEKAQAFTHKLALVYKYFLINKDRELISLEEELKFIDDYFFLLRIRHDDKVKMHFHIGRQEEKIMIVPCSLQLLIENAIKHNRFTEEDPLIITVSLNDEYLKVENNVRSKPYSVESTKIGLTNLSTHYKLICNKDILVSERENIFMVKLPLIKQLSI